ncbi:EamA domain-containing membrane protein RarD [Devosia crocina]|uniref:EamA domain-containing membrane protein RarD n=1 Tax=Devosia crocina TaxID=429728 RepID=A0A1I7NP50_9HYPH|nr:DMT family transporter [Devosia crocina]SFV36447.1 EamA domain-containing membrane protein RarD [Devosia crocina]
MTTPASAAETTQAVARGPLYGISLKVVSVVFFVIMAACLKATETIPAGELVFFRCFFAILPVVVWLAWRGQMRQALHTKRPWGHVLRALVGATSMSLGFFALTRLPLPEATAIGYAAPLLIVVFSAILLKERVHVFRWTAVIIGLVGVLIILWPRLTLFTSGEPLGDSEALGAIAAFGGAIVTAFALMQVRNLTRTERTEAIVVYFFIIASLMSLLTIPFGWVMPTMEQALLLVGAGFAGGIGQLLMTSSYRHADMSVIAPFEYVSLLLTLVIGFFIFGDIPTLTMVLGAVIIVGSGIAVILREHYLGLDRIKAKEASTP